MIKVAINGFGRIGRMVLRSIYENKFNKKIKVKVLDILLLVSIFFFRK